jgi:DNA-binding CsgD family transcriptional regulator
LYYTSNWFYGRDLGLSALPPPGPAEPPIMRIRAKVWELVCFGLGTHSVGVERAKVKKMTLSSKEQVRRLLRHEKTPAEIMQVTGLSRNYVYSLIRSIRREPGDEPAVVRESILRLLEFGATEALLAQALGVEEADIKNWSKAGDPLLVDAIVAARLGILLRVVDRIRSSA